MPLTKLSGFTFDHVNQQDDLYLVKTAAEIKAAFDSRGVELKTALNALIDVLQSVTDGDSGADNIKATAIQDLTGVTVQSLLESLRNILKSTTDGASGADFINSTSISGVTGTTVQSQLEGLKTLIDLIYTKAELNAGQLDTRYFTETELQATTDGASGADKIGVTPIASSPSNLQGLLEWLKTQIDNTALGQIPDGSVSTAKLANSSVTTDKLSFDPATQTELNQLDTATTGKLNIVYDKMTSADREIAYLKLKQQAADRIENGTTFASDMAGNGFGFTLKDALAKSNVALTAGTTVLNDKLVDSSLLNTVQVGDQLTILDDTYSEKVTVTRAETIDTTFHLETSALVNIYKSGAWVAQSTMNADGTFPQWDGNFVTNTVTDATVVASAYDTSGNGGRKFVRLSNGWLVVTAYDSTNKIAYFYVDKQDESGFVPLCNLQNSGRVLDSISIVSKGTIVYVLIKNTDNSSNYFYTFGFFDAVTASNTNIWSTFVKSSLDSGQTALGSCSLAIDSTGTYLHAVWASKNATYPNSYNLRYAKGTISAVDGSVSWSSVSQLSTDNTSGYDHKNPSIVVMSDGNPIILVERLFSSTTYLIKYYRYNGSSWLNNNIYDGSTYSQSSPSAIFVPQSINGLASGRIWVAWLGRDSSETSAFNVRTSYSDDGGITWSAMEKLTNGNTADADAPTITVNKNNKLYIITYKLGNKTISKNGNDGSWVTENLPSSGAVSYASSLIDFSLDFSYPLFIYKDTAKVGFYGTWTTGSLAPLLAGTAQYALPSTDYVGAFVQKAGEVNLDAYLNDTLMDESLEGDEYLFTKSLASVVPVTLRLEMSRTDTTGGTGDKISRILGGVS